jgi:hypothetical protein
MPRTPGRGHSHATLDKAQGLSKLLSQHVNIVKFILEKHPYFQQKYYFIYTYAGLGYNEDEQCDDSPDNFSKDGQGSRDRLLR